MLTFQQHYRDLHCCEAGARAYPDPCPWHGVAGARDKTASEDELAAMGAVAWVLWAILTAAAIAVAVVLL